MPREQAQEFFARQQEYWQRRDAAALASGHAEDGVLVSPIFRTVIGRPAILASYRSLFQIFPDWAFVGEELLVDGDRVAQSFTASATHMGEFMGLSGTGRKFQIQGVRLFTFKDALIASERRYYDFTGLLIQVGVLRSKPANPQAV
jgi:steroid delta-isomerase-like uncharacterized protein